MENKIKILEIITRLDPGGSTESVIDVFSNINTQKFDIYLCYGGEIKEFNPKTPNIYHIKSLTRNISLIKDFIAFCQILKIIIKLKPQIVHTHTSKAGILGRWAAFILRTLKVVSPQMKIIHTPHGHIFYGYYSSLITKFFITLEKITAPLTDIFIGLTEGEKKETIQILKLSSNSNWRIIPSGIDITISETQIHNNITKEEVLREFNIPPQSFIVGTVARLEPVKGIIYLVKSAIQILNSTDNNQLADIYFLIVGDGSQKNILKNIALQSLTDDKKNHIIFTGMRQDVKRLISAMDIYIQPSLNEGMGKTILEAMNLAKPIIASDVQGIPDLIINGITGILIPPANESEIKRAIFELISSPAKFSQLGVNAYKKITHKTDGYIEFSKERMIHLHEKLYSEITSTTDNN